MKQYFVKDGSRNCFIAEANLKDGSSIFSNGKNKKNTENAAEERGLHATEYADTCHMQKQPTYSGGADRGDIFLLLHGPAWSFS